MIAVVVGACAVTVAVPASALPSSTPAAPSIDVVAPSPTVPYPQGPPEGYGPGGSTIGGSALQTRGLLKSAGTAALPTGIDAKGWLVADLASAQVLAAQDPHGRYYPASTLKTLTMISLFHVIDPNGVLTATSADVNVEGTRIGYVDGGQYPVSLVWQSMMMMSGNDAAQMLAKAAGGVPSALKLMNEKAKQLQAYDTIAGTVSGLDVAGQSSSPYDLCLFMRQLISDPAMLQTALTLKATIPAVPPKYGAFEIASQDDLLTQGYVGALAAKNGFTDAARHTYVAAASRNGRTIVVSLMQAEQEPELVWNQAAALLDWAFSTPSNTVGVGRLVQPDEVPPTPSSSVVAAPSPSAVAAPSPVAKGTSVRADDLSPSHRFALWPIIPVLLLLIASAIRVAAPRRRRNRAKAPGGARGAR
ncbi:MAG: serine hydrolase [Antricoccus sp.]